MPETTTQKVSLAISRKQGNAVIEFSVPEVVRNVWAGKGLEVKTSTAWAGLSFYVLKESNRTEGYKALLNRYSLRDDFGADIIDSAGRFNVAFLRCTEGAGSIPLNSSEFTFAKLADSMRALASFVREFVEQSVADYRITGSISVEV